jgi:hypothetical protein
MRLPAPNSAPPTPEQEALGTGWNHVVWGGRTLKTHATSPTMLTNSGLGTQFEHQAAHSGGPFTTAGPDTPAEKSRPSRPNHADLTIPPSQSPIERIADLLDKLPTQACFEFTRRLLTTASSLPTASARQRSVLKNVILFVWLRGLGGQTGETHCDWLTGIPTAFAAESRNWISSSVSTASTYPSWTRRI